MLKKFTVENFKGFKEPITFDLTAHDYAFNSSIVKKGIVNKGLIYGKNGTGKTNLGLALIDISTHLTDKVKPSPKHQNNYRNLDSNINELIKFDYLFDFDGCIIEYKYTKQSMNIIVEEDLFINGQNVLHHTNFPQPNDHWHLSLEGSKGIDLSYTDPSLSALKYVYARIPKDENSPLFKLMHFVENMLWFRCLNDGNNFIGFDSASGDMNEIVIRNNKLKDFERFLKDNELNYNLVAKVVGDRNVIYAHYKSGDVPLISIISSGTSVLWLYYCWSIVFDKVSFVFMDEFDAFYHYETAEYIVRSMNSNPSFQAFMTTHNTYLMKNTLTRPDCCFILSNNNIKCIADCTDKEIREAHNLEKMYVNGAFNE